MKILLISDLHLCDTRNSEAFEVRRMEKLAEFIRSCGADLVVNIGDTVSRKEYLREEFTSEAGGFDYYLRWRSQFTIPFVECAVAREFGFFAEKMQQEPDSWREVSPEMSIITVAPQEDNDHRFTPAQLEFMENALASCRTPKILIASHVPYPGSCSREIAPGIFLEIPERLRRLVEESDRQIFWCGGHFHWPLEEVRRFGSLTAVYSGRFHFENKDGDGYLRMIDSVTGEVSTVLESFRW